MILYVPHMILVSATKIISTLAICLMIFLFLFPFCWVLWMRISYKRLPHLAKARYGSYVKIYLGDEDHKVHEQDTDMYLLAVDGQLPIAYGHDAYLPLGEVEIIGYVQRFDAYAEATKMDYLLSTRGNTAAGRVRERYRRLMRTRREQVLAGERPSDCIVIRLTVEPKTNYRFRPDPDTGAIIVVWENGDRYGTLTFENEAERIRREREEGLM